MSPDVSLAVPLLAPLAAAGEDLAHATRDPLRVLAGVLLAGLALAGVGCLLAVLRLVFPGAAARADAGIRRLAPGRLLATGILPVVGIVLIGRGSEVGGEATQVAYLLLFLLPAAGLVLIGASALVPHVGGGVLGGRPDRSLLVRSVVGALVLGLAFGAAALLGREAGAAIFGLLLLGWFFSAGFLVLGRRKTETPSKD